MKEFSILKDMAWQPVHPETLMDSFKVQNVNVVQSAGDFGFIIKGAEQDTNNSKRRMMSPSLRKGGTEMSSMEGYVFSAKKEFIPPDLMAGPTYVLNLTAQVITIILCLFLLRII